MGGDTPSGETMPKWQRELRSAAMAEIRRADKIFKQAAGLLLPDDEDADMPDAEQNDTNKPDVGGLKDDTAPQSNDEPVASVEDQDTAQEVQMKNPQSPTS